MRGFFVLLLLTNLIYFTWQYFLPEATTVDMISTQVGERLVLLSELESTQMPLLRQSGGREVIGEAPAPAAVAGELLAASKARDHASSEQLDRPNELAKASVSRATADSQSADMPCWQISNLAHNTNIDAIVSILQQQQAKRIEHGERAGVRVNYWVMIPAQADRSRAEVVAEQLREQRLRDFLIVRSGEHENAISLGVFSTRERASRRVAEVDGLPVSLPATRIELMELPIREAWVQYHAAEAEQARIASALRSAGVTGVSRCGISAE